MTQRQSPGKRLSAIAVLWGMLAPAWALEPVQVFARSSPAVWLVKSDQGAGKGALGSAVAFTPSLLVTACHVVAGAVGISIVHEKRSEKIIRVARDPDPARDLCVMQVADGVKVPVAAVAKVETLKVGQRVYAIGSPTGLELTLSEGLISALRANAQGQLPTIQTSAAISPGSSGGGLFDAEARLIGVTVSVAKGENLGFAYPAEWLAELPQRLEAELIEWRRLLQSLGVVLSVGGDPTPSGHAAIDNDAALPVEGLNAEAMRQAYRQFLLQARPRAFMITSDGKAGAVTSAAALVEQLKACSERKAQCAVYAVDSAVVWGKQAQASK